jgi:hypothetical protein
MPKPLRKRCNGRECDLCRSRGGEQLDLQALHRVREHWVMRGTAVVNQIRNLLLEREPIIIRPGDGIA